MTSIEWLDEQIQEHIISQDLIAQNLIIQISISDYFEIIQQAKQMHKEEISKAFEVGYENGACVNEGENIYHGSNYYKKTYGGNNE